MRDILEKKALTEVTKSAKELAIEVLTLVEDRYYGLKNFNIKHFISYFENKNWKIK